MKYPGTIPIFSYSSTSTSIVLLPSWQTRRYPLYLHYYSYCLSSLFRCCRLSWYLSADIRLLSADNRLYSTDCCSGAPWINPTVCAVYLTEWGNPLREKSVWRISAPQKSVNF